MSQTKVQLIAPIGVVTATTLETTGVLTATTFVGDIAGTVTGITSTTDNLNLGIITATSFAGDFTGIGSGLTGTPNVVAGVVTATKFVGNTPGLVSGVADGTNINAGIITATSFVGNITGNAAGLSTTTSHANLGIVTATSFHGSGANLEGVSSGPVAQQAVTANGATTAIDLSDGNLIYMTQSANTTVSFANTENNTDVVYIIRTKDDTTTARTITWPSGVVWDGGTAPTLVNNAGGADLEGQVFKLTTRDNGATWYGIEAFNLDTLTSYSLWGWGNNANGMLAHVAAGTTYNSEVWSDMVTCASGSFDQAVTLTFNGKIQGHPNRLRTTGNAVLVTFTPNPSITVTNNVKVYGEDSLNNEWGYSSTAKATIGGTEYTSSSGSLHTFSQTGALTKVTIVNNSGTGRTYMEGIGVDDHLLVDSGVLYPDKVSSPVQIPGNWSKLDNGNYSTGGGVAIRNNKTLWGWGYNDKGALGQNNRTTYSSPVQIPGEYSNVSWSYRSMGAVKTDGTLWAWGNNAQGQLGQNDVVLHSSPVQIGGDTTWGQTRHSLFNNDQFAAVKTDGTLWSWGSNTSGQLGHNQAEAQLAGASSPTQIPGTTWSKVSGGNQCFYATKTDNTLWAWGKNNFGQLGNNNIISHSSPVQIPGTTWNITEVSNSVAVISAFKTDGTLWGWGHNINGALGQNQAPAQLAGYSSPVQLSGTTWNQIATYDDGGRLATRSDGTAWTWGYNGNGGLGLNNTTSYSSPTQLPGTDWTGDITGKSTSFFALRTS